MTFEFATAGHIIFGRGTVNRIAPKVKEMGTKALLVMGKSIKRVIPLLEQLKIHRIQYTTFQVHGEPTVEIVEEALAKARSTDVDIVIGFGGGSAIDTGKAVAALLTNPGNVLDYLEVIGKGRPLIESPLPYIAVPTTAGTGAEVTKNAVLLSKAHHVKVSLRHQLMIPDLAVVDPELTCSMPPEITASTGLDALTQLIEPFVSNRANPLTDGICREGLKRASRSLFKAYQNGKDIDAREDMAVAGLFGGLALANAKLGAVHGFAGVLGGMLEAPHGAICARLLPFVIETNVKALKKDQLNSSVLERYRELASLFTDNADAMIEEGPAWIQSLCDKLNVPTLSEYGMTTDHTATIVEKAQKASSMKGNPVELSVAELTTILEKAM